MCGPNYPIYGNSRTIVPFDLVVSGILFSVVPIVLQSKGSAKMSLAKKDEKEKRKAFKAKKAEEKAAHKRAIKRMAAEEKERRKAGKKK